MNNLRWGLGLKTMLFILILWAEPGLEDQFVSQRLMQDFWKQNQQILQICVIILVCRKKNSPSSLSLRSSFVSIRAAANITSVRGRTRRLQPALQQTFLAWVAPGGETKPSHWCLTSLPSFNLSQSSFQVKLMGDSTSVAHSLFLMRATWREWSMNGQAGTLTSCFCH